VKTNLSLVTTWKMRRLVNENKNCVLMIVKSKDDDKSKHFKGSDPKRKDELVKIISKCGEVFPIRITSKERDTT
jgi:hypothetical protein